MFVTYRPSLRYPSVLGQITQDRCTNGYPSIVEGSSSSALTFVSAPDAKQAAIACAPPSFILARISDVTQRVEPGVPEDGPAAPKAVLRGDTRAEHRPCSTGEAPPYSPDVSAARYEHLRRPLHRLTQLVLHRPLPGRNAHAVALRSRLRLAYADSRLQRTRQSDTREILGGGNRGTCWQGGSWEADGGSVSTFYWDLGSAKYAYIR